MDEQRWKAFELPPKLKLIQNRLMFKFYCTLKHVIFGSKLSSRKYKLTKVGSGSFYKKA